MVQMMGLRGESMNPMTFGNMTHPNVTANYRIKRGFNASRFQERYLLTPPLAENGLFLSSNTPGGRVLSRRQFFMKITKQNLMNSRIKDALGTNQTQ